MEKEQCDDGNEVDGDGCNKKCEVEGALTYFLTRDAATYGDYERDCDHDGGKPAVLSTLALHTVVTEFVKDQIGETEVWIGLTDVAEEGVFRWSNGALVSFQRWNTVPPDNEESRDCVTLGKQSAGGVWGVDSCSNVLLGVCQR
ncbi:MAG: lectin-like protein [Kofleriaceae bacterium]